jgi:hypothetical protein
MYVIGISAEARFIKRFDDDIAECHRFQDFFVGKDHSQNISGGLKKLKRGY